MSTEMPMERPDFLGGVPIRLADGRSWIFPAPPASVAIGSGGTENLRRQRAADPDYLALLQAIREAEDQAERLRAELALMIHLLSWNNELGPDDYQRLLGFEPNSPALAEAQRAFHKVARDHLDHQGRSKPDPPVRPLPDLWSLLSRLSHPG